MGKKNSAVATQRGGKGSGKVVSIDARSGRMATIRGKRRRHKSSRSISTRLKKLERKVAIEDAEGTCVLETVTIGESDSIACIEGEANFAQKLSMTIVDADALCKSVPIVYLTDAGSTVTNDLDLTATNAATASSIEISYNDVYKFRNNFANPCEVTFYECTPKARGELSSVRSPTQCIQDGMNDSGLTYNGPSISVTWPSDVRMFSKNFKIVQREKVLMQAGDEYQQTISMPYFHYNPQTKGPTASPNIPLYAHKFTRFLLIKIVGRLSHDFTSLIKCKTDKAILDMQVVRTSRIRYAGTGNTFKRVLVGSYPAYSGVPIQAGPNVVTLP